MNRATISVLFLVAALYDGLLGLAFHPNFKENSRFFVYYSAPLRIGAPTEFNCTATWSEFQVSEDPNLADPDSESILLQVDKPQFNHNGGQLAFGQAVWIPLAISVDGEIVRLFAILTTCCAIASTGACSPSAYSPWR